MGFLRPTKPQVGAGNLPGVHAEGVDPSTLTIGGEQFGAEQRSDAPYNLRGFRARSWLAPAPGPATSTGAAGGPLAAVHHEPGPPDPDGRELWSSSTQAGEPGHIRDALSPVDEALYNLVNAPTVIAPAPPPTRARQGFTGDDNTRAARHPMWLFLRPFDQNMAQRLQGNKVLNASPVASRPIHYDAPLAGGLPNAPGGTQAARGMRPTGIQPNTQRLLPRPWDELLATTGQATATGQQQQLTARAQGWRRTS